MFTNADGQGRHHDPDTEHTPFPVLTILPFHIKRNHAAHEAFRNSHHSQVCLRVAHPIAQPSSSVPRTDGSPRWRPRGRGRPSGLFPFLVIINKATRHTHVVPLCRGMFLLPLGGSPGVEVLGCPVSVQLSEVADLPRDSKIFRAVSNVGPSHAASLPASATATLLFLKPLPEIRGGFSLWVFCLFFSVAAGAEGENLKQVPCQHGARSHDPEITTGAGTKSRTRK